MPDSVQFVGLAVPLLQLTPPVHVHWSNRQSAEDEGKFAVALKVLEQGFDSPSVKFPPQALIEPAVAGNVDGTVVNTTDAEAKARARVLAMGEPHPATGSHPTPAEYPLFVPEVTSWKSVE